MRSLDHDLIVCTIKGQSKPKTRYILDVKTLNVAAEVMEHLGFFRGEYTYDTLGSLIELKKLKKSHLRFIRKIGGRLEIWQNVSVSEPDVSIPYFFGDWGTTGIYADWSPKQEKVAQVFVQEPHKETL